MAVLLFFSGDLFSQDLYSHDNSVKFAVYLYQTNQFESAAKEFERCIFLQPEDPVSSLFLLKVYRKMEDFNKAAKLVLSSKKIDTDESFGSEYFKLLIQAAKYKDAEVLLDQKAYLKQNADFRLSTMLLQKEWKSGALFRSENQVKINKSLSEIVDKSLNTKRKNPVLAGIFSSVLPGSGKAYAGRWKDGLISFVMTSTTGFVAARGFNRNSKDVLPWVMGSFFVVYYSGNIYGSVHAANQFNKNREDEWISQVRDFVLHD